MRLNRNLASLNVYRNYINTVREYGVSVERISSGTKLNKAKDDPNKLAQSERMRLQIRSLEMASKNAQDAVSILQTAGGVMGSINWSLQRMRELVVQSGSGGNSEDDKKVIQEEINQIVDGIQRMAEQGDFNGVNIVGDKSVTDNRNPKIKEITVGSNVGEQAEIGIYNLTSEGLGLKDSHGNVLVSVDDLDSALSIIDDSLEVVIEARSKNGAKQNRFESMYENLIEIRDRNSASESNIRDTDIAEESIQLAKNNLLINSAQSIMAQTNKFPQDILRVLEGLRSR